MPTRKPLVQCDWCGNTGWIVLDYEEEDGGFAYGNCPKCRWVARLQPPIPAPMDALAFVSDKKRIALGEDEAWRQYAERQQT